MKINLKMKNLFKKIFPFIGILLFYDLNARKIVRQYKNFEWQPVGVDNYGNISI